jgi:hypothetical protein
MSTKEYKLGINDNKFWRKDLLIMHLYRCHINNEPTTLNVSPEGSSLEGCGVYRYLDTFCNETGYPKQNITIRTGNMAEHHNEYKIQRDATAWYEVPVIQQWLNNNCTDIGATPTKHFGHFIGKSNWNRLWIGAILHKKHSDKLFQTYNTGLGTHYISKINLPDFVGLEDLVKSECDVLDQVVEFLKVCPKFIPEDLEFIKTCPVNIKQQDHFPIQLPANLNILKYYQDIFVDVVHETFVRGDVCFATEKTWRPIIARRPFITMGGLHHLANLRRLGFRTFNNFWDEGYDEYGMQHRVKQIDILLDQIATWSTAKLITTLHQMQEILDHNYKVFTALTHQQIKNTFND